MEDSCTCVYCPQKQFSGGLSDLKTRGSRGTKIPKMRHRLAAQNVWVTLGTRLGICYKSPHPWPSRTNGQNRSIVEQLRFEPRLFPSPLFSCSGQVDEIAKMKIG